MSLCKKKSVIFLYFFSPETSAHTDAVEVPSKVSERVNSLQCEEENQTWSNSPRGSGRVASTKEHKRSLSTALSLAQKLIDTVFST